MRFLLAEVGTAVSTNTNRLYTSLTLVAEVEYIARECHFGRRRKPLRFIDTLCKTDRKAQ